MIGRLPRREHRRARARSRAAPGRSRRPGPVRSRRGCRSAWSRKPAARAVRISLVLAQVHVEPAREAAAEHRRHDRGREVIRRGAQRPVLEHHHGRLRGVRDVDEEDPARHRVRCRQARELRCRAFPRGERRRRERGAELCLGEIADDEQPRVVRLQPLRELLLAVVERDRRERRLRDRPCRTGGSNRRGSAPRRDAGSRSDCRGPASRTRCAASPCGRDRSARSPGVRSVSANSANVVRRCLVRLARPTPCESSTAYALIDDATSASASEYSILSSFSVPSVSIAMHTLARPSLPFGSVIEPPSKFRSIETIGRVCCSTR